jgi:outer membrane protein OmpA-like peptidoglycan-associated protein
MRIVEACDLPWDMLRGRGQVRFCQSCGKEVHDLTSMTESEARAYLFLRGGRLCSRSPTDSEGTILLPETRARRGGRALPLLAATLSATMTACSGPPVASEATASVAPSCQSIPGTGSSFALGSAHVTGSPTADDADGDGVPDAVDMCPREPGPASDDPKRNGCPAPTVIISETMGIMVLEQVHFQRDSARVLRESTVILDDIARVMKEHSEIEEVAVEGHASGDEPNARTLSEERARQGVAWLVAAGVDPRRLVARGWGAEHPLDSNERESGRQRNRRLEFVILTKRP